MTPAHSPDIARARARFVEVFGGPPSILASAPGRVNLIGEHTDYNGGYVLPMTIGYRAAIAARPNDRGHILILTEASPEILTVDVGAPLQAAERPNWTNYPLGILAGFRDAGFALQGFDALITSDVPLGAGLSSSAALNSAVLTLLETLHNVTLDPIAKVLLCQTAEHGFAGVPCGIMDYFISLQGRANQALLLDCRSQTSTWLPFSDPEVQVLVVNTLVRHRLGASEYPERRNRCVIAAQHLGIPSLRDATLTTLNTAGASLDPRTRACAHHVITEIARTGQAAECLTRRNWRDFGRLMRESHESLRDDFQVSCPELDAVVDIACEIGSDGGVYGARMTGAGFGGCAILLIRAAAHRNIRSALQREYLRRCGKAPTVFRVRPSPGAWAMQL
ncbi:MAG: galactokinase [Steroidobacteraceae bacterium]